MTQDGKIVIYHDYFLDPDLVTYLDGRPLSSSTLLIHSLPLSQLKEFDCGRKANPQFPRQKGIPGTSIPTLEELFERIHASSDPHAKTVRLNLEIKRDPCRPEYTAAPGVMAKEVLHLVQRCGFQDRVYYSSFDPESLEVLRALDPEAKIAFLKEDDLEGMIDAAQRVKAETVSPEHILIKDAEDVRRLQHMGFKVILWTVNDAERWEELIDMGVDGIITDYPEDLIHFLKDNAKKFTATSQ
jgi:glycerophosphoryl diester phosphodiesterase